MNLWMRWVSFQALREILLLIKATPGQLRATDLIRLTTNEGILLDRNERPLGPSSHYHHRRTLERLDLVVKRDGRYSLNNKLSEPTTLTNDTTFGRRLCVAEKEAFSNVILRNEDCRAAFFNRFVKPKAPYTNVREFIEVAQPIELNVVQRKLDSSRRVRQKFPMDSSANGNLPQVAMRTQDKSEWSVFSGTNAVQSIHYGLRSWCVDQLCFLDIIYRSDGIYTMFPIQLGQPPKTLELTAQMIGLLRFEGEWATVRVGDFALAVGITLRVPIEHVKIILSSWMDNYPDVVAGITTSERFITSGLTKGQHEMTLKGFLLGRTGAYVSHLRIHKDFVHRTQRGVSGDDFDSNTQIRT